MIYCKKKPEHDSVSTGVLLKISVCKEMNLDVTSRRIIDCLKKIALTYGSN